MNLTLDLLSVNVGMPAPLGVWQGEPIISGIRKAPVDGATVRVSETNIEGDGQADLSDQPDKAIYAYPSDHWAWWKAEAAFDARPASFGENLTLSGADEQAVRIGDRFSWGDVVLEVSHPRAPCFKFAMMTGREDLGSRMIVSARTGWYLRVVQTGEAPTRLPLTRTHTDDTMPTVRDAFVALYHPRARTDVLERVLAAPALARSWRGEIVKRRRATAAI